MRRTSPSRRRRTEPPAPLPPPRDRRFTKTPEPEPEPAAPEADPEAEAIRMFAEAGMLSPSERRRHAEKITRPIPAGPAEVFAKWRRDRAL